MGSDVEHAHANLGRKAKARMEKKNAEAGEVRQGYTAHFAGRWVHQEALTMGRKFARDGKITK